MLGAIAVGAAALVGDALVRPNVLLLIADDLGNQSVGIYDEGPPEDQPPTPTLDRLARSGVWFGNAYANPICSSTRATIFSGRYSFRTGIGNNVKGERERGLAPEVTTLPEVLSHAGYQCALVGKWHLGWSVSERALPIQHGWQWFTGTERNLPDHFRMEWYRASSNRQDPPLDISAYSASYTTDRALDLLHHLPSPWFVTVSYHAVHGPEHVPPPHLHDYGTVVDPDLRYLAMVQALDTEIGRLLASPDLDWRRTLVIFLSDNGARAERVQFQPGDVERAKGTVSEAGTNVPLIVSGFGVVPGGGQTTALVNTTDLFATCLDIAGFPGSPVPVHDSESFAAVLANPADPGPRSWVFSEVFPVPDPERPTDERAVRGARYKLSVEARGGTFEFHDFHTHGQENVERTLLCRDEFSDEGFARCREQLDPGARRELRRLRRALDDLDTAAGR